MRGIRAPLIMLSIWAWLVAPPISGGEMALPSTMPTTMPSDETRIIAFGPQTTVIYTQGTIHCTFDDERIRVVIKDEQRRQIAQAAAKYLSNPGPFYSKSPISDGYMAGVRVTSGDRTRITSVFASPMPAEMRALLERLADIVRSSDAPSANAVAAGALRRVLDNPAFEPMSGELERRHRDTLMVIPNYDPRRLIPAVLGKPHRFWMEADTVVSLEMLAEAGPAVADAVWTEAGKHPEWEVGLRLTLLESCVRGGSRKALSTFASSSKSIHSGSPALREVLEEAVEPTSLDELKRQVKARKLDAKAASEIWNLLVANIDVLDYDPAFNRYAIRSGAKLHIPPAQLAADAKKIAQLMQTGPLEVTFDGSAIEDAVLFISDISGVQIEVDWTSMDNAGISKAAPVAKVRLRNARLGAVLNATFGAAAGHPLSLEYTLSDSGALVIGAKDQ